LPDNQRPDGGGDDSSRGIPAMRSSSAASSRISSAVGAMEMIPVRMKARTLMPMISAGRNASALTPPAMLAAMPGFCTP
jgi:hypothetical protein